MASLHLWNNTHSLWEKAECDPSTNHLETIQHDHANVHRGKHFFVSYSVADLGAATSPDDMMTVSWTTPNTTKWLHLTFSGISSSGARVRLIEGKTGGGANPTGTLQTYNSNRNSTAVSTILDVAGGNAGKVSYDATLFTGGTTLIDQFVGSTGLAQTFTGGTSRAEQEIVLKQNTAYQISILETDNVPGTIQMSWYEHTDNRVTVS